MKKQTSRGSIGVVIRYEYIRRFLSIYFIFSTLLPIIAGSASFFFMQNIKEKETVNRANELERVLVIDHTGEYLPYLVSERPLVIVTDSVLPTDNVITINKRLSDDCRGVTQLSNELSGQSVYLLEKQLSLLYRNELIQKARITLPDSIRSEVLNGWITLQKSSTEPSIASVDKRVNSLNKSGAIIYALLIYLFLLNYGVQIYQSVMEEKSNRIAEVLMTAIAPIRLLFGKIIAIGLVGLTQLVAWIGCFLLLFSFNGVDSTEVLLEKLSLPHDFDLWSLSIFSSEIIALFILLFIGGYLFYSSLFTALGASFDNANDSSQMSMFIVFPLILSIFVSMNAIEGDTSMMTQICTYLPFTSPIVLLARFNEGISLISISSSLIILYGSAFFILKAAVKVYERGMIHYGSKVTFKQIIQWIKH